VSRPNVVKIRTPADKDERCGVAQEAVWQIACLFDEFANFAMRLDHGDTLHECTLLRALAARGRELSHVAMTMLGESGGVDRDSARQTIAAGAIVELREDETLTDQLLGAAVRHG